MPVDGKILATPQNIIYLLKKIWNNYLIYSLYKSFLQEKASKCSLDISFGMKQNRKCSCDFRGKFALRPGARPRPNILCSKYVWRSGQFLCSCHSGHSASIITILWNDIHNYIDYNVLIFHKDCSKADGDKEVYLGSRLPTTQFCRRPVFRDINKTEI